WGLDGAIHGANGPARPSRLTLANFPVTDGKGIVVIEGGRGVRSLFLRKRDLTPEAAGCCLCFCTLFF
ncbi:hypothetical protein, partial [Stenotrophomonas maltophilia]